MGLEGLEATLVQNRERFRCSLGAGRRTTVQAFSFLKKASLASLIKFLSGWVERPTQVKVISSSSLIMEPAQPEDMTCFTDLLN